MALASPGIVFCQSTVIGVIAEGDASGCFQDFLGWVASLRLSVSCYLFAFISTRLFTVQRYFVLLERCCFALDRTLRSACSQARDHHQE